MNKELKNSYNNGYICGELNARKEFKGDLNKFLKLQYKYMKDKENTNKEYIEGKIDLLEGLLLYFFNDINK